MKYYKQILEAINRGIQYALDDYDYNNILNVKSKDKVIDKEDSLWQSIQFNTYFVDLGLPSKTIWCKYNLGVNPNKLETFKDWRGGYYAWGELEEKDNYVLETYTFIDDEHYITKYTNNKLHADGKEILDLEDDVAYQNPIITQKEKYIMCIPTPEQFQELIIGTTSKYIRDYNGINGMHVIEYTSKSNGKKIIFPLGGYKTEDAALDELSIDGCYWTNYVDTQSEVKAWQFSIAANYNVVSNYRSYRAHGRNIRPVLKNIIRF